MSNILQTDQARRFVGPDLGPNYFKGYQQTTNVAVSWEIIKISPFASWPGAMINRHWHKLPLSRLIVLGFNGTSSLVGHFVSSPREREKRDRNSRGDEREGRGGKRNEQEWKGRNRINKIIPLYAYLLQGMQAFPIYYDEPISLGRPSDARYTAPLPPTLLSRTHFRGPKDVIEPMKFDCMYSTSSCCWRWPNTNGKA